MSNIVALSISEARLYVREWGQLVFSFLFPPLLMLILAGVFAADGGPGSPYGSATGAQFYVVSYVAVPIGSIALTSVPVMLAGYREHGILKRFGASGVRPLQVISAQAFVSLVSVLLGALAVLIVAAPTYGVPAPRAPLAAAGILLVGAVTMLGLGIALGLAVGSVRVANALGLSIFFPVYLLGGGGPPYGVLPPTMQHIADWLPMTPVTDALRGAWLGNHVPSADLVHLAAWLILTVVLVRLASSRTASMTR